MISERTSILCKLDNVRNEMLILESKILDISTDLIPCRFSSLCEYYTLTSYQNLEIYKLENLYLKMGDIIHQYKNLLNVFN
jgi:hypothetical protein